MDFELTPAQQALRARARELADGVFRERAARWDAEEAYPWDNVKDLVRAGLMGITIRGSCDGPATVSRRMAAPAARYSTCSSWWRK